jgi:ABC-type nickel/cobalt efflux system permease component RcnA
MLLAVEEWNVWKARYRMSSARRTTTEAATDQKSSSNQESGSNMSTQHHQASGYQQQHLNQQQHFNHQHSSESTIVSANGAEVTHFLPPPSVCTGLLGRVGKYRM